MKIENSVLINSIAALRVLGDRPVPVRTSFALAQLIKQVDAAAVLIEDERRKLLERYGRRGDDGQLKCAADGMLAGA